MTPTQIIHQEQPVLNYGTPLNAAKAAVILLHGRGATAQSMLDLALQLPTENIAYLMPQAANNTWYPNSGFGPLEANQPFLTSALDTIANLIEKINSAGIPTEKIVIGGFSQGACLTSEFITQNARRYGGILMFSGALMGTPERERAYQGSLDNTPVFIGGVDQDSWVTKAQLQQTADILRQLGGRVALDIVSGTQHSIRQAEMTQGAAIISALSH
jgi:phospholipase/carboxylesterase